MIVFLWLSMCQAWGAPTAGADSAMPSKITTMASTTSQ